MRPPLTSRDWFGKSMAGLLLGFFLALGAAGLLRALGPAGQPFFSTRGQFTMWMMGPIWGLVLSLCFLFRSGTRAWAWLALANLPLWAMVYLLGGLGR